MGEARTFQQVVQELPKRNFVDLVGQPSPIEEDFEEPMNVASSDDELHEDFFSGEEFASAPDDSEVPKDPRMKYQTQSASSHAETPAAMTPKPAEAPSIPKVEQSPSTARPSVGIHREVWDQLLLRDVCFEALFFFLMRVHGYTSSLVETFLFLCECVVHFVCSDMFCF